MTELVDRVAKAIFLAQGGEVKFWDEGIPDIEDYRKEARAAIEAMRGTARRVEIFWSDDDKGWIALDPTRPGCSAFGNTEGEALSELQDARNAWDGAKAAADKRS